MRIGFKSTLFLYGYQTINMKNTHLPLYFISICLTISSCSFNKDINQSNSHPFEIISAVQTPLVGGANKSRGMRIGLQLITQKPLTADSIIYEGFSQPVTEIKKTQDTLWIESYFYPNQKMTISKNSEPVQFMANSCTLFYHYENTNAFIHIKKMEMVQETTQWE